MSQEERKAKQLEASSQQAAEVLRWRQQLGAHPLAIAVARCFPLVPSVNRCWAAHWVIGAANQAARGFRW